jgi:site-specific DNA-methyltransferase (adenine-specific)
MENGPPEHSRGNKRKKGNMDSDNYGKQSVDFIDKTGSTEKFPTTLSLNFQKVHPSKCLHPTQKPVPLLEYLIKTYTEKNQVVLDNCAGSGTTGIACMNTDRYYILMEKEKKFYNITNKRIKDHRKKTDLVFKF